MFTVIDHLVAVQVFERRPPERVASFARTCRRRESETCGTRDPWSYRGYYEALKALNQNGSSPGSAGEAAKV
jgi:hypothetical protein